MIGLDGVPAWNERRGHCYQLAAMRLLDMDLPPGSVLVHGTIQRDPQPPNPHAWVRAPNGSIFDGVLQGWFPPGAYEAWANAEPHIEYSLTEAANLINQTGHWGPWEERP